MEVHLPEQQEARLNALSAESGRGTDELVQEAVAQLLTHNEWFRAQVQIGIGQIARGELKRKSWTRALSACFDLEAHPVGTSCCR
jgi:predicted transcriptional regulator